MTAPDPRPPASHYWRGVRHALPFLVIVLPFGLLFGVVASEAGLSLVQVMSMSVLVIAGASQLTALHLLQEHAPTVVILAAALAVNLRMAMYSAALVPYLGMAPMPLRMLVAYFNVDQTYALAQAEFEKRPELNLKQRLAYFFGVATPVCPTWYVFTLLGAVVGAKIPPEFALDFAMPIAFLAMIAPALRTLAHVAAAITSIVVALALAWMPSGLGLLVAGPLAMMVGARTETWLETRKT